MEPNTDSQRVALLYARISVTDANVPKVANQLDDLNDLADRRGLTVAETYKDDGLSAATAENRPSFDRLLADLPKHPGAVILATEEARLARNELEKATLSLACANVGATWETVRDGAVDPATAAGALMSGIRGAIDSFESRRKAERQKAANAHRREQGKPYTNCVVPFGWMPDRVTVADDEAALIRQGTADVLAGKPFNSIMRAWRATDVRPRRGGVWTTINVRRVLCRHRNAGLMTFNDEPTGEFGDWQAIVTPHDLEQVRAVLMLGTGQRNYAKALLTSVAQCECGAYMISASANGRSAYICSSRARGLAEPGSSHCAIKAAPLDAAAREAVISTYLFTPRASTAGDTEAEKLAALHTDLADVRRKLRELYDDKEDCLVTRPVYAAKFREHTAREAELIIQINQAASATAHARMLTETRRVLFSARTVNLSAAAEAKKELGDVFDALTLDERRRLVAATVRIEVRAGRGMGRVSITGDGLPSDD